MDRRMETLEQSKYEDIHPERKEGFSHTQGTETNPPKRSRRFFFVFLLGFGVVRYFRSYDRCWFGS